MSDVTVQWSPFKWGQRQGVKNGPRAGSVVLHRGRPESELEWIMARLCPPSARQASLLTARRLSSTAADGALNVLNLGSNPLLRNFPSALVLHIEEGSCPALPSGTSPAPPKQTLTCFLSVGGRLVVTALFTLTHR
jgi:hypothetical protein